MRRPDTAPNLVRLIHARPAARTLPRRDPRPGGHRGRGFKRFVNAAEVIKPNHGATASGVPNSRSRHQEGHTHLGALSATGPHAHRTGPAAPGLPRKRKRPHSGESFQLSPHFWGMDRQSKPPTIALVLKILGIGAIVIAPLGVLSFIPSPSEPSQSAAPLIWFAAVLVSGLLLFGFASVIE